MKKFILLLAVAACIETPSGITDYLDALAASGEVASVTCAPASLAIAVNEVGSCSAFNADGTRLEINGVSPVIWVSSDPTAVSVSSDGEIRAESVVSASVTITATGINNSIATAVVAST